VLQNAGPLLIANNRTPSPFDIFFKLLRGSASLSSLPCTPPAHTVHLLAESQASRSSLKVFAADACEASCRVATEVIAV
jgi:hypothetical protein